MDTAHFCTSIKQKTAAQFHNWALHAKELCLYILASHSWKYSHSTWRMRASERHGAVGQVKRATRNETDGAPILGWLPLHQRRCLTNLGAGIAENVPSFIQWVFLKQQPPVAMANYPRLHCITVPSKHHSSVKCPKKIVREIFPILSEVIFNSAHTKTQKRRRRVLPNLSFNLDEGVVIGRVTIATVTARVAAWKME